LLERCQRTDACKAVSYRPVVGILRADLIIFADALRLELKKLGWIDGANVVLLDPRTADGRNERLPLLAEELVRLDPAVIVVQTAPATRALKQASRSIPIVMVGWATLSGTVWSIPSRGRAGT
jgi:putative ABC transport system substrate-binding protein